jgi:hypothetical protein
MKNKEKVYKADEKLRMKKWKKNEMINSSILKLLKLLKPCNFLECFWTYGNIANVFKESVISIFYSFGNFAHGPFFLLGNLSSTWP